MNNEVIKVYGLTKDGCGVAKKPCWNVRINGQIHEMWFGTKRAALAYLARKMKDHPRGKTLVQVFANEWQCPACQKIYPTYAAAKCCREIWTREELLQHLRVKATKM